METISRFVSFWISLSHSPKNPECTASQGIFNWMLSVKQQQRQRWRLVRHALLYSSIVILNVNRLIDVCSVWIEMRTTYNICTMNRNQFIVQSKSFVSSHPFHVRPLPSTVNWIVVWQSHPRIWCVFVNRCCLLSLNNSLDAIVTEFRIICPQRGKRVAGFDTHTHTILNGTGTDGDEEKERESTPKIK